MTHEYVIALGGTVLCAGTAGEPVPTAIAWAADRVLAVGSDDSVRSISRGDSVFLDLAGCIVTPLPAHLAAAGGLLRDAVAMGDPLAFGDLLVEAGLVDRDAWLEPGTVCDLAFWDPHPGADRGSSAASVGIVAVVRAGAFTQGDEHLGPFQPAVVTRPRGDPPA